MKKANLYLFIAIMLAGCAADQPKQTQAPQFGQPTSTIPWNQPETWEKAGQLGAIPGLQGQ